MKKLGRFQLNEKQLGYAMILPSLILVFAIALWPVAHSFYNSLFDYRLNDPYRSQKMLNANIDLERYVDNYFYIDSQLSNLENNADGDPLETVENAKETIESYHSELTSDAEINAKVEQIDEMLMNFEPITDSELKYAEVENAFAEDYRMAL